MKEIRIVKSITNRDCDSISLFFKDIYKYKPLSQEEEFELAKEHTQESLNKLVNHNLRFVITVAKQYQGQGLPLEDLISEGSLGLMKAAERFDPDRGFKFISYAVWWIRQSIVAAIYSKSKTIRSTTSFIASSNKLNKIVNDFIEKNGYEPSDEELSEILNISIDEIVKIRSRRTSVTSLDTPISEDSESSTLVDVVQNNWASSPETEIANELNLDVLKKVLNKLSDKEFLIIKEHYGLFDTFPKPFDEIGKKVGLTGERCRQIHNKTIKFLKDNYGDLLRNLI